MSESYDYEDNHWDRSHTFGSARQQYRTDQSRAYGRAKEAGTTNRDLLLEMLVFECLMPLVLWFDVTGSMEQWPPIVFDKAPYLQFEVKEYLGPDNKIAVGAFGDAPKGEDYPLQIREPATGAQLKARLNELVRTGLGGNNQMESSDLAALYALHKVQMPKGAKPVMIIVTDEAPYPEITPATAREKAGVEITDTLTTEQVFRELREVYAVYVIQKPYVTENGGLRDARNRVFNQGWKKLVGERNVVFLEDPQRVVDVIFGILATITDRWEYFLGELRQRQSKPGDEEKIRIVLEALKSIRPEHEQNRPSPGERVDTLSEADDVGSLL